MRHGRAEGRCVGIADVRLVMRFEVGEIVRGRGGVGALVDVTVRDRSRRGRQDFWTARRRITLEIGSVHHPEVPLRWVIPRNFGVTGQGMVLKFFSKKEVKS